MTEYSKAEARTVIKSRLDTISDDDYLVLSNQVRTRLASELSKLQNDKKLLKALAYKAIPKWREINLSPLEALFGTIQFDYIAIDKGASFPTESYDVVLVPLYGFSVDGYRLGHGSGWYDKLLSKQIKALKVGVGFEASCIDFKVDSHDIPMDVLITEARLEILQKRNRHSKRPF